MGVPGNIYSRGVAAVFGWIAGWFLGTAIMPLIAHRVRRPAVPTRTFPEFIHVRYDPFERKSKIQIFVAVIELVGYFVFSFIQVQGFGIVLSTISGLNYNLCCVLFLVVLVFTSFGGFQSVARTDTVNAILILIGVIAGMVTVLHLTGGFSAIVDNFMTTTAPVVEGGEPLVAGVLAPPGAPSVSAPSCPPSWPTPSAPPWPPTGLPVSWLPRMPRPQRSRCSGC